VFVGVVQLPAAPLQQVVQLQHIIVHREVDERVPQVNLTHVRSKLTNINKGAIINNS
jgi:hypothetical protein